LAAYRAGQSAILKKQKGGEGAGIQRWRLTWLHREHLGRARNQAKVRIGNITSLGEHNDGLSWQLTVLLNGNNQQVVSQQLTAPAGVLSSSAIEKILLPSDRLVDDGDIEGMGEAGEAPRLP
jgi:hypothetical protein